MTPNFEHLSSHILENDPVVEAKHSKSKCMNCSKPPMYEVLWAEGMGHAWFCLTHLKEFSEADGKDDICSIKAVQDGKVTNWKDNKSPNIMDKVLHMNESVEGISAGFIFPNGKIVKFDNYQMGDHEKYAYKEITGKDLDKYHPNNTENEFYSFLSKTGAIRWIKSLDGSFQVEIGSKRPTNSQIEFIKEFGKKANLFYWDLGRQSRNHQNGDSLSDLLNSIKHFPFLNEDAGGEGSAPAATTQANVDYLPTMIGDPQRALNSPKKKKRTKKIKKSFESTIIQEGIRIVKHHQLGYIEKLVKSTNELGNKLFNSSFKSEQEWKKFWVLTDGTVIPVDYAHVDVPTKAVYSTGEEIDYDPYDTIAYDEGAIPGYIDDTNHSIGIRINYEEGEMTELQIESFKRLVSIYNVNKVEFDDIITRIKSPEHLEYVLQYDTADMDEGRQNEATATEDAVLGKMEKMMKQKFGNASNRDLRKSSFYGEEDSVKFWLLEDGTLIPVDKTHEDTAGGIPQYKQLAKEGAIRGHINTDTSTLSFGFFYEDIPTIPQIERLTELCAMFNVQEVFRDKQYLQLKSPQHLEYVLMYGDKDIEEKKLYEAFQDNMTQVQTSLKPALEHMYGNSDFLKLDNSANQWRGIFGGSFLTKSRDSRSVLVTFEHKDKDIKLLVNDILASYQDDKGYLDMVVEAINSKEPLSSFEIFEDKDFLYGTRIRSVYNGTSMIFESTIDMNYQPSETILMENPEAIDAIKEGVMSVKVSGRLIYPSGGRFTLFILKEIASCIDEL